MAIHREIEALFAHGTGTGLSDGELLDRFQRGRDTSSERAFESLVERHGPMVLRTCQAILGDRQDAEDAFQVTFLVLARKAGSIRRRESVTAWLHGVACRTAAYARGSLARRRGHERAAAALVRECVSVAPADDVASRVQEEVARLPVRLRSALLLCEFEGLTGEEAAKRLNCPVGTVKSRLSRAKDRLRNQLAGLEISPGLAVPSVVPQRLIAATIEMICGSPTSGSNVFMKAAFAAWETAILRSLLMSKLKFVAAAFTAVGFVAAGTAFVARAPAASKQRGDSKIKPGIQGASIAQAPATSKLPPGVAKASKPVVEQPQPPDPDLEFVSLLARTRVELAERMRDRTRQLYQNARVSFGELMRAEELFNESKLEASDDPEDRIAVLRKALDEATEQELIAVKRREAARASEVEVEMAKDQRIKAALRLAEETTGRHPSRKANLPKEPLDAKSLEKLLGNYAADQRDHAIASMLNREVTLELAANATLADALKAIKSASVGWVGNGLAIYVDPEGIAKVKVSVDSRVNLPPFKGQLFTALHEILQPLGLNYSVSDGLIKITAP